MNAFSSQLNHRLGNLAVLMCGFRPFFVLTAASAAILLPIWLLMLNGWLPLNLVGGNLLWHAHELIFAFIGAATAGFVLTALPEFTHTTPHSGKQLWAPVLLWLAARIAYLAAGLLPSAFASDLFDFRLLPVALLNLAFWLVLLSKIIPPAWQDPERRHLSFIWAILALAGLQLGFFTSLALGREALSWLQASIGPILVLIILAASRVSMAVMNGIIEQGRPAEPGQADNPNAEDVGYLARPPRRNLAIFCITLCTLCEFIWGPSHLSGWTALAAAAAMLNLLNDWHIGKPLFNRWALMMYVFYWLIALGYGLMGAAWLGAPLSSSAGRHLLMAGAMSLSIFTIMALVGRIHAGLWLDRRLRLPITATVLIIASLLRAAAGFYATLTWLQPLLLISGSLWAGCFALYLIMTWRVLTGPRSDNQTGCAEPLEREAVHLDEAC